MDHFMYLLTGETIIFGITFQNWILIAVFIFSLWILYLFLMSQLEKTR